jgi:hypothetical protein
MFCHHQKTLDDRRNGDEPSEDLGNQKVPRAGSGREVPLTNSGVSLRDKDLGSPPPRD